MCSGTLRTYIDASISSVNIKERERERYRVGLHMEVCERVGYVLRLHTWCTLHNAETSAGLSMVTIAYRLATLWNLTSQCTRSKQYNKEVSQCSQENAKLH